MAGQYEKAITIKQAIDSINNNDFLLPAIQRKFVWSSHQICVLFDSIMRDFPINSFMFWEVAKPEIKKDYKFYQFLKAYCVRFNEENPELRTNASFKDFKAVIDGQQRLTSLYIGLCGTYAYKQARAHWPSSQDSKKLPPRKLYLDLLSEESREDDDSLMKYRFKFLTDSQYQSAANSKMHHWFPVQEVLNFDAEENANKVLRKVVMPYLQQHALHENDFAIDTLSQLYDVIRVKPVIHYFNEYSQEIDHVLDVFIRTNSGGTKLEFSDLLMSIAVANWNGNFRQEVDSLIKEIHQSSKQGFYVGRDWILKTCLMLTEADVKFKVKNFKAEQVSNIQSQWENITDCIRETFKLVRRMGINPESLTSKNAVIPICYYLYKKQINGNPLYKFINNLAKADDERKSISQWFYMVLLKGIFGGQADTILSSMRQLLRENLGEDTFPIVRIIKKYEGTNKDLRFDTEYLDKLLDMQHGEVRCRALLHLLFPEMNPTEIFHIDHLHPSSAFDPESLKGHSFLNQDAELMAFYSNRKHFNSIANLHLLNHSQNLSKGKQPLTQWLNSGDINLTKSSLLLSENVSLEFSAFKEFYEARRSALMERLNNRVFMSETLSSHTSADDSDEELIEEAEI
jgi:uncharacterized protein with ParB-like and HNH nuclease domain